MAKILVHTLGSSGDFNPFAALALELRARGHEILFALAPAHAARARALGFAAVEAGPDPQTQSDLMRRLLAPHRLAPIRVLFEEVLIPAIVPAAEALTPLAREADLFLSHTIQLAAPAIAHLSGVPWVSAITAPLIFPTGEYPPPGVAWKGGPAWLSRLGWEIGRRLFAEFDARANAAYEKLGAPPRRNIAINGAASRRLTVGLWSPSYFPRPSDWPDWLRVGGYARWDAPASDDPPPPPTRRVPGSPGGRGPDSRSVGGEEVPLIVFTLGSSVVNDPRGFYEAVLQAVAPTGWRALLLGAPADLAVPAALRERVAVARYAPYAEVFPRADAIVHQGGVGTTQAACYYGVPSIVVPRGFDQFENAAHVQRNLWGLRLQPEDFSPRLLRLRLERLLRSDEIRRRVGALGARMRGEDGPARSADLVESAIQS